MNTKDNKAVKLTLGSLTIPILLENLLRFMMGTANVFILSNYSDEAVSAVGVSNQYIMLAGILLNLLAAGSAVAVSQALGSGDRELAGKTATVTVAICTAFGLFFSVCFIFLDGPMLSIMDLEDALMTDARVYLQIAGGAVFLQGIVMALSILLRSFGYVKMPLVVAVIMNVLNILSNYIVIFRPFEVPLYGVSGVAICFAACQLIGLIMIFVFSLKYKIGLKLAHLRRFPLSEIKSTLTIGIPAGLDGLSYNMAQILTTAFVTSLGVVAVSAKVYAQTLLYYAFIVSISSSQAVQILIANKVGGLDMKGASKAANDCVKLSFICNVSISLIIFFLRFPLLSLFTENQEIIHLAALVLLVDIIIEAARSLNNSMNGALRGAGDVKVSMFINVINMWFFSVGIAYLFGVVFGWGLIGIWAAFALDESVRSTLLFLRWKTGKWKKIAETRVNKIKEENTLSAAE